MVLVRMRYFRQHIIATHRKKTVLQSMRDRLSKIVTGVGHSIPHRHVEAGAEKHVHHGSDGIQASDGIGAALAGGAVTGLGLGIALGRDDSLPEENGGEVQPEGQTTPNQSPWRDSSSNIRIAVDSPVRASPSDEVTMNPESEERGIIADAQSFTSSPRSGAIPLQSPTSVQSNHVRFPMYMEGIGDVGTIRRRPGRWSICCSLFLGTLTLLKVYPSHGDEQSSSRPRSNHCPTAKSH